MKSRILTDLVLGQFAIILELRSGKDEALLIRRNAPLKRDKLVVKKKSNLPFYETSP
jgi:hypothetical protein